MTMTKDELKGMLDSHFEWLRTKGNDKVSGERLQLIGEDLSGADLRGCYLNRATLRGVNLDGANLEGAYLVGANLEGCNLKAANLRGVDMTGVNLLGANLFDANLDILKASPFVYDALSAVMAAQIALKKTEIDWLGNVMG